MPQGQLFVISAPSGAGKTSLVAATITHMRDLAVSVSHTTRSPRPGEVDGRDYHFVEQSEFEGLIASDALFEYAEVFGNFYGTSKKGVEAQLAQGTDVILEIDWQGAAQFVILRQSQCQFLFFHPPATRFESVLSVASKMMHLSLTLGWRKPTRPSSRHHILTTGSSMMILESHSNI